MAIDNALRPDPPEPTNLHERLLEGLFHGPSERALNGAGGGSLLAHANEGAVAGGIAGALETGAGGSPTFGGAIRAASLDTAFGVIKGAGAATAVAGADLLLQKYFGHNVYGHDLFRGTSLEMLGMGVAAGIRMDIRLRLGFIGAAWLGGRIENYFDA